MCNNWVNFLLCYLKLRPMRVWLQPNKQVEKLVYSAAAIRITLCKNLYLGIKRFLVLHIPKKILGRNGNDNSDTKLK